MANRYSVCCRWHFHPVTSPLPILFGTISGKLLQKDDTDEHQIKVYSQQLDHCCYACNYQTGDLHSLCGTWSLETKGHRKGTARKQVWGIPNSVPLQNFLIRNFLRFTTWQCGEYIHNFLYFPSWGRRRLQSEIFWFRTRKPALMWVQSTTACQISSIRLYKISHFIGK